MNWAAACVPVIYRWSGWPGPVLGRGCQGPARDNPVCYGGGGSFYMQQLVPKKRPEEKQLPNYSIGPRGLFQGEPRSAILILHWH